MTGFAEAEVSSDTLAIVVEARSLNARHLEISTRLPRSLATFEMDVRRLVQTKLERGRVEVNVKLGPAPGAASQQVVVDELLARQYLVHARTLAEALGAPGEVSLDWVLDRPGVIRLEEADATSPELTWPIVAEAVGRAVDDLVARRAAEGEVLAAELRGLHGHLLATAEVIAARAPLAVARREERLRRRIASLVGDHTVDEQRVLTEVAVWADKTDVSEELTRLRAHLVEFRMLLDKGGPVGRPLDFLIQELNRELNTVGSKADDLELSQAVLAAKGVLEKIREQVQNLE